jgi:molybdenum cofactor biosynthesis protein A
MLTDPHGRTITYLRLAVTDRCNLRCLYCMPEQGLNWVPRHDLLSFEEIMRMLRICASLGVTKLRLTGGEPFLRKDLMQLIRQISDERLFQTLTLTTNGTLTAPHVPELKRLGVHSVNLSADTLDPVRFEQMTRRAELKPVLETLDALLSEGIPTRLNAVIMEGKNEQDLFELASLATRLPVGVRFIEEMPFNGTGDRHAIRWNWKAMLDELTRHFPGIRKIADEPHGTSLNYEIPGAPGSIGIIPAYTRSFCGSCNRIRLTPKGMLKTCLYDNGVLDVRALIRSGRSDEDMKAAIAAAVSNRAKDGFEAERRRSDHHVSESMATIGG